MEANTKSLLFAVCDKDRDENEIVSRYLSEFHKDKGKQVEIHRFFDTEEIINSFRRQSDYAAMFIGMNSMEEVDTAWILRRLAPKCALVIVSDCGDYGLEGYRLEAFDYWLRPLDENKANETLTRLKLSKH